MGDRRDPGRSNFSNVDPPQPFHHPNLNPNTRQPLVVYDGDMDPPVSNSPGGGFPPNMRRSGVDYLSPGQEIAPVLDNNLFTYSPVAGTGASYQPMNWDRPVILIPTTVPTSTLFYLPSGRAPGSDDRFAERSEKWGIIYIPYRGLWYLKYNGAEALTFRVIDASNPNVASKYLSEPGYALTFAPDEAVLTIGPVANIVVRTQNVLRRFIIIQNTGANSARILAAGTGVAATATRGLLLAGGGAGTLTLAGDTLIKGEINAFSTGGTTLQVLEGFIA